MIKDEKIKELIDEGNDIKSRNMQGVGTALEYISGEEYETWISKVTIFVRSNYPENPLETKFLHYVSNAVGFGSDRFNAIVGILKALDSLGHVEGNMSESVEQEMNNQENVEMVFISHATQDSKYAELLVRLLTDIGLKKDRNTVFCSSVNGHDILPGEDIYDYLRKQFNKNIWVIFLLTDNYYKSAACLNEMGATWVKQMKYTTILVPPFNFAQIKGAINPMMISFTIDNSKALNNFRNEVQKVFGLPEIDINIWESDRDRFLNDIEQQLREDMGKNANRIVSVDDTTDNSNGEAEILLRFDNKSPTSTKCKEIKIKLLDFENNEVEFLISGDFLDKKVIYGFESRVERYTVSKKQIKGGEDFNFRRMKKWDAKSFWGSI